MAVAVAYGNMLGDSNIFAYLYLPETMQFYVIVDVAATKYERGILININFSAGINFKIVFYS
ncbi:MAG: hypothetical protein SFU87_08315 [Chitinophagaceae bacterium]|nr:hypothetical protein [Chitinophagaceae bacterium]